ncbi:MAG: PDZ domain-containing protein, partial [bacterium]|nr:PDZ domain-containing protein [bacterium]
MEVLPRFSPDGTRVAFGANYDGTHDLYEMSVAGGIPKRLTYTPSYEDISDYTPDGKVLFSAAYGQALRQGNLFTIDPNGGRLPVALPVKMAEFGSVSADGRWLAFTPFSYEWGSWNRYQGGSTADIWLFNLDTHESRRMTNFAGTDDMPMWHDQLVYYVSDCGSDCRRNIHVYDMDMGSTRQVTNFTDYDVKWPSAGPNDIVFEQGGKLLRMSLPDEKVHEVPVILPGDRPALRTQSVEVGGNIADASVSPQARRVALELRGDIWTVPAEKGYPVNLTRSSGSAERSPVWSPDGKRIAYFSDVSGEYELWTIAADGSGEASQLTKNGTCFRWSPLWSPDSRKIAFSDKTGALYIQLVDSGETVSVDRNQWGPWGVDYDWAGDSGWLAYTTFDRTTQNGVVKLYSLTERTSTQVTSPEFDSRRPSFDKTGDYLYFATDRNIEPLFGGLDDYETFLFTNSTVLAVMPLRKDVTSPLTPKNDEDEDKPADDEEPKEGEGNKAGTAGSKKDEKKEEPKPLKFDLEGAEARSVVLPLPASYYSNITGGTKKIYYIRSGRNGSGIPAQMLTYDIAEQKEEKLLDSVDGFQLTPDTGKAAVFSAGRIFISATVVGQANLDKPINMEGLTAQVNPREEWRQVVLDAWRIYRDFFYDPNMHGVDWPAVRDRSLHLVEYASNRDDIDHILSWMISEVNASHTFVWNRRSDEHAKQSNIGMLACDYEVARDSDGREGYRIAHIYKGAEWELDAHGPLSQAGVDVKEGDFLLAVNGVALDMGLPPTAAFMGMAGRPARITVSAKALIDKDARSSLVVPLNSEHELRLRDWIESNRKYIADKTGGRVGYIYVRSTGVDGLQDLQRQFVGQHSKQGLVIDERWNSGGFIPHRFIELLNRPARTYYARRDSLPERVPFRTHLGPKAMLINHAAGSGGDLFPYMFRQSGLGTLIGTRTWGGMTAIDGFPSFVDGGSVSMPTMGAYEIDGTWSVEGYGVQPDIEVYNDPTSLANGVDLQLDKGIEVVEQALRDKPWIDPPPPSWPDRTPGGSTER